MQVRAVVGKMKQGGRKLGKESNTNEPLNVDTIAARLGSIDTINGQLGADTASWRTREIGDGKPCMKIKGMCWQVSRLSVTA